MGEIDRGRQEYLDKVFVLVTGGQVAAIPNALSARLQVLGYSL